MMKSKVYLFLKNNIPDNLKQYIYPILNFKKNLIIKLPLWIIKNLRTNIYGRDKKKIFSLRNFGGSSVARGFSLFRTDPEVAEWIETFEKDSCFIDIGANIGIYSLYAAHYKAKVYSFEPESLNFSCLNLNISDNKFNNQIIAFPLAISSNTEISSLNLSKIAFGGSGHSFDRKITDSGKTFETNFKQGSISCSLDEVVEKFNIFPNYIKIDTDGNELKVLNGMKKTLNLNELKSICIELNLNFSEHLDAYNILKNNFKTFKKFEWYKGQDVFNYIFYR